MRTERRRKAHAQAEEARGILEGMRSEEVGSGQTRAAAGARDAGRSGGAWNEREDRRGGERATYDQSRGVWTGPLDHLQQYGHMGVQNLMQALFRTVAQSGVCDRK